MNYPRYPSKYKISTLKDRLDLFSDLILNQNANFYMVDDIPVYCEPGINFEHFIHRMRKLDLCNVSKEISLKDREPLSNILKSISEKKGAKYFDFHDSLCNDKNCTIYEPYSSNILYSDGRGHFSINNPTPFEYEWSLILKNFLLSLNTSMQ